MRRAVKIRVYPNDVQMDRLTAQWGAVRFVWNKALHAMSHAWKVHGQSLDPQHDLKKLLPIAKKSRRYGWLAQHDSMALQQALINLKKARQSFFERRTRYPKFKRRHDAQSSYHCTGKIGFGIDDHGHLKGNGWITLPKMPGMIRTEVHREIDESWKLMSITMKMTKTGKVFATLLFETCEEAPQVPAVVDESGVVGIDLGIKDLLVASDGTKVPNPRHLLKADKVLRKRQKALSRKKKGSANRAKARVHLAKAHERLANVRADYLNKLSKKLVDENQAIGMETLRVKNMMKNRRLARAIGDVAWGELGRQVAYKALWAGKHSLRMDQWYASTKECSCCGLKNDDLTLKDRSWQCGGCGSMHDRDVNAAKNIRQKTIIELRAKGYVVRCAGLAA